MGKRFSFRKISQNPTSSSTNGNIIAPIPAIQRKNITIQLVTFPSARPQKPSNAITPLINSKTPIISVFRSFEIFLSWRLIVVERLREGLLELVRLEEFLLVVFLAICLNRKIVLIIACVFFLVGDFISYVSGENLPKGQQQPLTQQA